MRIFYVNGDFVPEEMATVSVLDRGFLMADAVYEVVSVIDGKLVDFPGHVARLEHSTSTLGIQNPFTAESLLTAMHEISSRNALTEGRIYLQISRGVMERDFAYPEDMTPTVVMFTQSAIIINAPSEKNGIHVLTRPDLRWGRGNIKTTQLLYASMMKTDAVRNGADDCWLERDGVVMEGTSNNAYIIKDNEIITTPNSNLILPGITRNVILELCQSNDISFNERPFSVEEAYQADEAFITSAGALITGVVKIGKTPIGNGEVGPITQKLRALYIDKARATGL